MIRIAFLLLALMWASAEARAQEDDAATKRSVDAVLRKCAGGNVWGIEGAVEGELTKFIRGAKANGRGNIRDLGAIIDKLKPDAVGVEFYRLYTQCVDRETTKELERLKIPVQAKMTQATATKIDWPASAFLANMVVYRVHVSRKADLAVTIYDANCAIDIWLAAWVWPPNRNAPPVLKTELPKSAVTARSYPFEARFKRDGKAVDDAGFATRELPDFEFGSGGRAEFFMFAIKNPDDIEVYLIVRARADGCGGAIAIEQVAIAK